MATQENGKQKPTYIEAVFDACLYYEIEDVEETLNIKWENVEKYWIKYCNLVIITKDGQEYIYSKKDGGDVTIGDFKRPSSKALLDEDFWKIEE